MYYQECHNKTLIFISIALCAILLVSCSSQAKQNHLKLGEEYLQKRKYYEAVMEFRSAAEIDKNSGEAYWGLARANEKLGEFSETIDNLRKTVELAPQNLEAKAKLGNYFLALNPPAISDAEKILDEIFAQDSNFIEGYILKAGLLTAQNKPEKEVFNVLKQAIAINPKRTESYISLSRYFMKKQDAANAEKAIVEGINAGENKPIGIIEYGKFLVFTDRTEEAEAQFLKALQIDTNNLETREAIADFYVGRKQFQKAEAQYLEIVKIQENSPESRIELANFYQLTGNETDAIRVYEEIIKDLPEYARAHYRLAELYLERKQYAEVSAEIEKLLSLNDSDSQALMLRARLYLADGKPENAVKDLEEILKKQPSLRDGLFYMAQARLALGQPDQARTFVGDLERYHPNYLPTKLLKIQASFVAGQTELARREANELLELLKNAYPNAENSAVELESLRQKAVTSRGLANLALGKIAEAKTDLQEVARLSPRSNAAMLNLAKVATAEKNYNEALSLYEKVLNTENNNFDALSGLVTVLNQQGNSEEANRRIDSAMQKQNGNAEVAAALHYLKAKVAMGQKNAEEAEKHLKNSIAADEDYLPAYTLYASILITRNQTAAAVGEYKKLSEKMPSAAVYTLLGMVQESANNLTEAENSYRKALEIAPENPIASNNLAWIIAETGNGNLDEALKLAQSAVDQNQTAANYFDTLGWVYFKKGLYSPAIEQLRRAISIDETNARNSGRQPNADFRVRLQQALATANKSKNAGG